MKFNSLHVYGRTSGFSGSISVDGDKGEVKLNLSNEQLGKIMEICCDSLVEVAVDAAESMKKSILESLNNKED